MERICYNKHHNACGLLPEHFQRVPGTSRDFSSTTFVWLIEERENWQPKRWTNPKSIGQQCISFFSWSSEWWELFKRRDYSGMLSSWQGRTSNRDTAGRRTRVWACLLVCRWTRKQRMGGRCWGSTHVLPVLLGRSPHIQDRLSPLRILSRKSLSDYLKDGPHWCSGHLLIYSIKLILTIMTNHHHSRTLTKHAIKASTS